MASHLNTQTHPKQLSMVRYHACEKRAKFEIVPNFQFLQLRFTKTLTVYFYIKP